MKKTLALMFLLPILSWWSCGTGQVNEEARRPERDFENLLLILVDTLRSDHLQTYG
nr:hypothetical protein [Gammaproteobacteria bacterium]